MQDLIDRLVRPEIQALHAYHVPEAAGLIKLDAMENPYPWPAELQAQWLDLLQATDINRYPHPQAPGVQAALREAMGISDDMGLILGNGSDELIQMLAMTVGGPGRKVLSLDPGFVMYRVIALLAGMADGQRVHFLDISDKLLAPNGDLTKDVMPDALHPQQAVAVQRTAGHGVARLFGRRQALAGQQ